MIMMMTTTMMVTIMTIMAEMLMNTTTTMTHMTNFRYCLVNGYAYMLQRHTTKMQSYTQRRCSQNFALAMGRLLTWPWAGC